MKYKPGDRVAFTGWGGGFGTIVKASKVTAQWHKDGDTKNRRDDLAMFRLETVDDVRKQESEIALKAWRGSRPVTMIAHVEYESSYSRSHIESGVTAIARTPGAMRDAAADLLVLADWFDAKPGSKP